MLSGAIALAAIAETPTISNRQGPTISSLVSAAQTPEVPGDWTFAGCERGQVRYSRRDGYVCRWSGRDETGAATERIEYFEADGEPAYSEHLRGPIPRVPVVGPARLPRSRIEACARGDELPSDSFYWPPRTFEDNWFQRDHMRRWFSGQLCAMAELPLGRTVRPDERAVRLLVLPSFTPAYMIRVSRYPDDLPRLVAVRLDGAGGYDPGGVENRVERRLTRGQWDRIESALRQLDLWSQPTSDPSGSIILDGTSSVVEFTDGRQYHVVERHYAAGLRPLERLLERLADLPTSATRR